MRSKMCLPKSTALRPQRRGERPGGPGCCRGVALRVSHAMNEQAMPGLGPGEVREEAPEEEAGQ